IFGDEFTAGERGAVFVFQFDGASWNQEAKLVADDGTPGDQLGFSVAIEGDICVAGAPFDDPSQSWPGSAYVFERKGIPPTWVQTKKLLPADPKSLANFGESVGVTGTTVLVGSHNATGAVAYTGACYVFERSPSGSWAQTQKLFDPGGEVSDFFGSALSVRGN